MLIVGFGAGVTAGSFVLHPEIERIVICEMEPLIPPTATQVLRQRELQRDARSARADRLRRRAPLRADHAREVRHHHVRSDSSLGERQRHALLEGILRAGEAAPESRRRGHAVGAAVRERRADGEERDRHVLRRFPERHDLGQRQRRRLRQVVLGQVEPVEDRRRRACSSA